MYKNPKLNKSVSKAPAPLSPKAKRNLKNYASPVSSEDEEFSLSDMASSGEEEQTTETSSEKSEETSEETVDNTSNSSEEEEPNEELLEKIENLLTGITIVDEDGEEKEIKKVSKELEPLLLIQEDKESDSNFLIRKELTNKIAMLRDPKLNWVTSMVVASMLMNKANLNVMYSNELEEALAVILNQLENH
jgi:hypothetical protein